MVAPGKNKNVDILEFEDAAQGDPQNLVARSFGARQPKCEH